MERYWPYIWDVWIFWLEINSSIDFTPSENIHLSLRRFGDEIERIFSCKVHAEKLVTAEWFMSQLDFYEDQ